MSDQLFQAMRQSIIDGASDTATELAQQALANGVDPLEAVNQGFAAGITFAGVQFGCGQMFLPDLLFPRYRAVVFVHGCFWHHHSCPMFKMPVTRAEFWRRKISENVRRDNAALDKLAEEGWRVFTVWECALRGPGRQTIESVVEGIRRWLDSDDTFGVIRGTQRRVEAARM